MLTYCGTTGTPCFRLELTLPIDFKANERDCPEVREFSAELSCARDL